MTGLRVVMSVVLAPMLLQTTAAAAPAANLTIDGAVEHPRTLSLADLKQEPVTTETVFLHTGHGTVAGSFTGVLVWTLLREAGVKTDPAAKNDIIRHVVLVTGGDGYSAVLSLGELDPEFGGDQAIIAYEKDGKPFDETDGLARLIIPGDKAAGRAVNGIASITVK